MSEIPNGCGTWFLLLEVTFIADDYLSILMEHGWNLGSTETTILLPTSALKDTMEDTMGNVLVSLAEITLAAL